MADYKQILAWVSRAFEDLVFDCDPGKLDDNASTGVEPVRRFQKAYNLNQEALGATAPELTPDGDVGPLTWGAFFDCYEFALREELGEDAATVAALREQLVFADPSRKSLGFSEHFPIEELGEDNFRSQANRRVEILFFEAGEEPDLVAAENDPETSELYLPGHFERTPLDPMLSAKPWRAAWEDPERPARSDQTRPARVAAPGLPAGTPLTFIVTATVDGEDSAGFVVVEETVSAEGAGEIAFGEWFDPSLLPEGLEAESLSEFPSVEYSFTVEGGGRLVTTVVPLPYADTLRGALVHEISGETAPDLPYRLALPWGFADFTSEEEGKIEHEGLPPGGALVIARESRLVTVE